MEILVKIFVMHSYHILGVIWFGKPILKYLIKKFSIINGFYVQDPHILARTESGYNKRLLRWRIWYTCALHGQPLHFYENCAMLYFSCGGTIGKLHSCCHVVQITADR